MRAKKSKAGKVVDIRTRKPPPKAKAPKPKNLAEMFPTELVPILGLRPHPKNYKKHPAAQLEHIGAMLKTAGVGFYKNVVIAKDGTILAGHGVVEAARSVDIDQIPVRRLPIASTSALALKIVAGDNEISRLAESDERGLTLLLKEIVDSKADLMGSGFDESMFSVMLTLNDRETAKGTNDVAGEWLGMPECESEDQTPWGSVKVNFASEADMKAFAKLVGQTVVETTRSVWYPKAEIGHFADKAYQLEDVAEGTGE